MKERLTFAILGAGAGGHAMSADLSLAGYDVRLYDLPEFQKNIRVIQERGGIQVSGLLSGFVHDVKTCTDVEEAVEGADVIMITAPAFGHKSFVERSIPHLSDGQILLFNTGYYACLRFRNKLKAAGKGNVILAETMILPYTCRMVAPGHVYLDGKKKELSIAALPASKTSHVMERLGDAYPEFKPAANVLETSINNLNLMGHVPITLLNRARVETVSPFNLPVKEGVTPSVGRLMETADRERMAIGEALEVKVLSIQDMLRMWDYCSEGESVYELFQGSDQFDTFQYEYVNGSHQYLKEDLPYGLVPTASLADLLDVPAPTLKALVEIFAVIDEIDYWQEGITVEKLGLTNISSQKLIDLVTRG
jgi:opine dehydrogenase